MGENMNRKLKGAVDVAMSVALLFLTGYQFWGDEAHEWAGAGIFVLFAVHHILNWRWHKNLFRGKYSLIRVLQVCIDILTWFSMIALIYSSIVLSRYVFSVLPIEGGMALARRLHILGSYWGFLLMNVHLGLHWNMVIRMAQRGMRIRKTSKIRSVLLFLLGTAISLYGIAVFIRRDFLTYLLLKSEFVFLDYGESVFLFYIDYLALMGLCIFIAYYLTKLLRKVHGQNNIQKDKQEKEGGRNLVKM